MERCIAEVGIGFLFAPRLHPAFKAVAGIRRELGIRTVFNLLGPLANPAGARHQVMGVYEPRWVPILGGVLAALGAVHAFVVHGEGLDEIAVTGTTHVAEVKGGAVRALRRHCPRTSGWGAGRPRRWPAATPSENAAHPARRPRRARRARPRDAVLANAAAALVGARARRPTCAPASASPPSSIDRGAAAEKLERLAAVSRGMTILADDPGAQGARGGGAPGGARPSGSSRPALADAPPARDLRGRPLAARRARSGSSPR